MFLKLVFVIAGIIGVVAIFYVSWFWRGLIIPMVVLMFVDLIWGFLKKDK